MMSNIFKWISTNKKNVKINSIRVKKRRLLFRLRKPIPIILKLTSYQNHDLEQSSKSFSRQSLFIKKLLIKNVGDSLLRVKI